MDIENESESLNQEFKTEDDAFTLHKPTSWKKTTKGPH